MGSNESFFSKILSIIKGVGSRGAISSVVESHPEEEDDEEYCVFDLKKMNRDLAELKSRSEERRVVSEGVYVLEIRIVHNIESSVLNSPS